MTNPNNLCIFTGVIPTSDKIRYEYYKDESYSRMNVFLNVRRNWKKKDDEYYANDLIKFVAFGPSANYLNEYVERGNTIQLVGSIEKEDDYEKDGEKRYGQLYLKVDSVSKIRTGDDGKNTTTQTPKLSMSSATNKPKLSSFNTKSTFNLSGFKKPLF